MNPRCQFYMPGTEGSLIVRVEGLEPPWIAPPDPKSGMSTNFTTPAFAVYPYNSILNQIMPIGMGQSSKKECKFIDILLRLMIFFQNSGELVNPFSRSISNDKEISV